MVSILSGERLSRRILTGLKKRRKKNISLAVVQVGENPVSGKYIREKRKVARELGVGFRLVALAANVSQTRLEREIQKLGTDKKVSGMIVQLPLPKELNTQKVLDLIPKEKDVDVLSTAAFESFKQGKCPIVPPTVCAIARLLKEAAILQKLHDREVSAVRGGVVIVGKGKLVGLPLAIWFNQQGIEPTMADKTTSDISAVTRRADILVSAAGQAGLITGDMVKKGAVVIDAGTSVEGSPSTHSARSGRQAKLVGDVDFASVSKKASYLTPVPGGVGPLTVACLFLNLTKLNEKKR